MPTHYVVPSPEEPAPYPDTGTWGGVSLDHAKRQRRPQGITLGDTL